MTHITEKLMKVVFTLKMIAWVFVTTFGMMFTALMPKKDSECPYSPVDGDSESIRALNYQ